MTTRRTISRRVLLAALALCAGLSSPLASVTPALAEDPAGAPLRISLDGIWQVRLDPGDMGFQERWHEGSWPDGARTEVIRLPGSLAEHGIGDEISITTRWTGSIIDSAWFFDERYAPYRQPGNIKLPFWLTPQKHYVGPAWYRREIIIPGQWKTKRVHLMLERAHWETLVWVDGKTAGMENSLCTPHNHDAGTLVPGRHVLVVRVDNRVKINVGRDAHSICDHTQTNWNGLIGRLELQAFDPLRIADLQVYPDLTRRTARIRCTVTNDDAASRSAALTFTVRGPASAQPQAPRVTRLRRTIPPGSTTVEADLPMGEKVLLWDEFDPSTYLLVARLAAGEGAHSSSDHRTTRFGMREFRRRGTNFTLNGRTTFLRGTLEACTFPLTGYPPTETPEWARIFTAAKAYGLNHIRFHSWCPPEAAFEAADSLGIMLQVETPVWAWLGRYPEVDAFIHAESERILKEYGNHPSFCMLAVGNEPSGEGQRAFLSDIVSRWKAQDPRRLYTTCSGWPLLPVSDYNSTPEPRAHAWGAGLTSRFNALPFSTDTDYTPIITRYNAPTISHEVGQWCAFPDLKETAQYTGVVKAQNFEIVRDDLERKGMIDQAEQFLMASGRLQTLEYKEEIEAALRTRGFGGFQLLGLHDFPGQGTALVGVLNVFWRSKGYATADEFHRFCSAAVPLMRMPKVVWTSAEVFSAETQFANYAQGDLKDALPFWSLTGPDSTLFASGVLDRQTIPQGGLASLGRLAVPLRQVRRATKLTLTLGLKGTAYANSWDIWVYPDHLTPLHPEGLLVAHELSPQVERALRSGGRVLLLADPDQINSRVPAGFSSIFWNTSWTGKQPPHTLGILCDPAHPLFAHFPTESHSTWQWWDLVRSGRSMILDSLPPGIRPLVQVIDDWNTNRRLGLLFEAKVGSGSLLVCSMDLSTSLAQRPVARQFLHALMLYVSGNAFRPHTQAELSSLQRLFQSRASMDGTDHRE